MIQHTRLISFVALVALGLAACSSGGEDPPAEEAAAEDEPDTESTEEAESEDDAPTFSGPLVIALDAEPTQLDPHRAVSGTDLGVVNYAYDTLLDRTATGEVVPGLAESWEVESPTSVTLTLRADATCEDGTPVTPSLVQQNFDRWLDPETAAPYIGEVSGGGELSVTSDDDAGTVTVETSEPFSGLAAGLAVQPFIVCPGGLDAPDQLGSRSFGTGPFVLTEYRSGDQLSFARRDGYAWGPDGATTDDPNFPEELVLRIIDNETTRANVLLAGDVQIAPIQGEERNRVSSDGEGLETVEVQSTTQSLWINQAEGRPASDLAVRQALVQAVEREGLMTAAFGDFAALPSSLLLANAPCAADVNAAAGGAILGYEPEIAAEALAGVSLRLVIPESVGGVGELLQARLIEAGADVTLDVLPGSDVIEIVTGGGDWDVTSISVSGETPSKMANYFVGGPPNFWQVDNPEYAALADEAKSTIGDDACAVWAEAEVKLHESANVYPYAEETVAIYGRDGVGFAPWRFTALEPTSLRVP